MSRLFIFLNIFFVLIANTTSLTEHNAKPRPRPKQTPRTFVIPILKDTKTGLYYTNMTVGQPPVVVNLVVDVSGSGLFFQCDQIGYNSTTYTPVLCGSRGCAQTKDRCTTCYGTFGPTCRNDTCIVEVDSDLAYTTSTSNLLSDDVIISYTSPSTYLAPKLIVRTRLACVPVFEASASTELPYGANGILGLANSSTSFVKGLVSFYKIPFKVAICLPSKPGNDYSGAAYIGGGQYSLPPNHKDVTRLLVSTPLLIHPYHGWDSTSHYIDVKSMEVNGKRLSFNQTILDRWGSAKISINLIPYTRLETSIYKSLVKAFAKKSKKRNAVAPFTDCFSYKSFGGKSLLGDETPVISLVLVGGAKWDIYGPNSLVKVKKTVVCLAFKDAGRNPRDLIDVGGYQVEDNLVEFDLEASKFSVTSSLLHHNTSSPM